MNKLSVSVLAFLGLFAMVIAAQEPAPVPKPGPEHEKLAYFVGKWVSEAEVKPSPFGPAVSSPTRNPAIGCQANSRFYAGPKATCWAGSIAGLA